ncbi:MAG: DNA-binding response regulator, LuxR family [Myxococcaceae bacterium]|nr:DNA-binding response regulator, LuxR family [Myxococcaceae bacterium]
MVAGNTEDMAPVRPDPLSPKAAPPARSREPDPFSMPPPELNFAPRTLPPLSPLPMRASPRDEAAERPISSTAQHLLLQRVLNVLVLPARDDRGELTDLLRSDSLRVVALGSVAEILAAVQEDAPDLVLADERLAAEGALVAALRSHASADASTDFVPVVLVESTPPPAHLGSHDPLDAARDAGDLANAADVRVLRPFGAEQLVRAIGRATGTLVEAIEPRRVGDLTLDELADRVACEVRRGLVDSVTRGRAERVALGDGGDVLAAAYGAIAELRAAVVRQSQGRVEFEARGRNGVPALVSSSTSASSPARSTRALEGGHREDPLPSNGAGQARPASADSSRLHGRRIVLAEDDSAIALLFANLLREEGATVHEFTDGRAACEAAQRERPALVITGARVSNLDGFSLARELARDPLLADVPVLLLPPKEQLFPRSRDPQATAELQRELAEQVLSSAVRLLSPRSELEAKLKQPGELRGNLEGMGVIALLRSVRRARPDARVRVRDAWNLFECELREGRLAQVTRTASDGSFVRNERALPQLLGATAGRFSVIEAEGPMKTSFEGTLDEVLMRGARELAGELDAVSGARLSRVARIVFDEDAYALLLEQTPRAVRLVLERLYAGEAPSRLLREGLIEEHTLEPILLDLARRGALRGVIGSAGEDLVAEARAARAEQQPIELASPLSIVPPPPNPVISMLQETAESPSSLGGVPGVLELHDSEAESAPLSVPIHPVVELPESLPAPLSHPSASTPPPPRGTQSPQAQRGDPVSIEEHRSAPKPPAKAAPVRAREASVSDASEIAAAAAEARRSRSTLVSWGLALLGLLLVALFVASEPEGNAMPEALGGGPSAPSDKAASAGTLSPRHKGGSLISAEDNGFAVYDGILDSKVEVAAEQALLVVEDTPALRGATVFVNDRELGAPPQQLVLPEGVHELAIKRGDAISYRFVSVHPGRTWVLRNP